MDKYKETIRAFYKVYCPCCSYCPWSKAVRRYWPINSHHAAVQRSESKKMYRRMARHKMRQMVDNSE